jgi:hypothetical protein
MEELWAGDGAGVAGAPDLKRLACQIDCLEKQIDKFGTVVPKHADVWGQSRLMMHRQEFEREMKKDITTFQFTIQGSIATSDQAFLANAFGLQAAIGAQGGAKPLDVTNLVSGNDIIARDKLLTSTANTALVNGKLAIEPTLILDQKRRFLNHLHELRRMNEGDDNTDAPGYTLDLVSIPISVLTGDCTQTGYGAECTITAAPHFTDDLLPNTFRDLVINDLVDLLGLQVTKVMELLLDVKQSEPATKVLNFYNAAEYLRAEGLKPDLVLTTPTDKSFGDIQKTLLSSKALPPGISPRPGKRRPIAPSEVTPLMGQVRILAIARILAQQLADNHLACKNQLYYLDVQAALRQELNAAYDSLTVDSDQNRQLWGLCTPEFVKAVRSRDNAALLNFLNQFILLRQAPTELQLKITKAVLDALTAGGVPPEVVANLSPMKDREFDAPHKFLEELRNRLTGDQLACYQYMVLKLAAADNSYSQQPLFRTITDALAWTIILDATLLNDRFLEDMRDTQSAKGCPCAPPGWVQLCLPNPPPETRQLFNNYVSCRWPLHVFALDPETEDQNIADSFRLRREMQLALSLAFTSGQISASNFTRYTRRIEQDIDTIALNRTMIGFSHGDDTFGWRFYPRMQTPPIDGNLEAIFRDLLVGGRGPGYSLRRRQLENGMRDCVALVIMPSFVPYVDLDVHGNWFRLDHPKCKELTLKQTMRLSQEVRAIQEQSAKACDQGRYRPGDAALMMKRLDQLSVRLPLQHQLVSIPYENTHGGFELLSVGSTDLAPELVGFYGAPGINPTAETTLFLVGNNFSVHQTRVIVGGRVLDASCPTPCSSPSTQDPCDCKTSDQGGGKQADATTAAPTPAPACCAMTAEPDSGVRQAALFSAKTPTTANITTVLPPAIPPVLPPAITLPVVTTSPTATASPTGTVSPTVTISPTVTASPTGTATVTATTAAACPACPAATPSVPLYQVELLSRQIMRVVIPKGVYSKDGMVDIAIGTPYWSSRKRPSAVAGASPTLKA